MSSLPIAVKVASLEREVVKLRKFVDEQEAELEHLRSSHRYDTADIKALRDTLSQQEERVEQKIGELVQLHAALERQKMLSESLEQRCVKAESERQALRDQRAISDGLNKSAQENVASLRNKVRNLTELLRGKLRVALVFEFALRSTYIQLPSVTDRESIKSLLIRTKRAVRDQLVDKHLAQLVSGPKADNPGLASPVSPPRGSEARGTGS
ncbi:hypothetical protein EDB81DRAFT_939773 [Dactylonectria macrodidyma]|uniref:Uncharacterized protein n=1 Tax=Dactylonectria macrodidyma TaxID=307937 RepID=A0A9P9FUL2_9HYPO|nr:hypothetical protein EDB81DRAFT_939773 [Dactylonectria macrodidyma]